MTTTENLLRLMNLPLYRFSGVCRTSDGFYLAQAKGDIGYNVFLGSPNAPHEGPGRELMLSVWKGLTKSEKQAVLKLAAYPHDGCPILLRDDFGVPVDDFEVLGDLR